MALEKVKKRGLHSLPPVRNILLIEFFLLSVI